MGNLEEEWELISSMFPSEVLWEEENKRYVLKLEGIKSVSVKIGLDYDGLKRLYLIESKGLSSKMESKLLCSLKDRKLPADDYSGWSCEIFAQIVDIVQTLAEEDVVCQICFDGFSRDDNALFVAPCSHPFHRDCILVWKQQCANAKSSSIQVQTRREQRMKILREAENNISEKAKQLELLLEEQAKNTNNKREMEELDKVIMLAISKSKKAQQDFETLSKRMDLEEKSEQITSFECPICRCLIPA